MVKLKMARLLNFGIPSPQAGCGEIACDWLNERPVLKNDITFLRYST